MQYQYPEVGSFYQGNNVSSFCVWSPLSDDLQVVLNGRQFSMTKDEHGYWQAQFEAGPDTPYLYRINHEHTLPDPASMSQPEGVHGPSHIVDRSFAWTDFSWKGKQLGEMIIYELHVGTFTSEGTFEGVISKLPYLKELGINAIELMPVAQFPGTRNWGYDGVYPFAVQDSYGGAGGLKKLVNEAHRNGIAVILDVVYNHQGPEGNYFSIYGPYFTEKYKTFWGGAINYDDAWCDGVRHFYWQNAVMWLDEFHIDGLRLDAVHAIWDFSARHFIEELKAKVTQLEEKTGRKKILIAEFDLNNPRYINPPFQGGYGLDGQWIDEFHHALHSVITGETDGYYEDFGRPSDIAKALKDSYVYTGQYSVHRKKLFGALPKNNPYSQFVVFAQNHDQIGNRLLGDRLTTQLSLEGLKLAAAAYLLSPHVPMLFMGEEYGEKNPFQYFISHTEEELVQMVREGRKKEFSYFNWQGEVPDPQSEETFRKCVLSWNYEDDGTAATMLTYYKELIAFRKTRTAMQGRERNSLNVLPSADPNIVSFERSHEGDRILIVLNFSKERVPYSPPYSFPVHKIFDSSSDKWRLQGKSNGAPLNGKNTLTMNAESAAIFEF
jgi:maltooligosyltrehalose trehalohydrolase